MFGLMPFLMDPQMERRQRERERRERAERLKQGVPWTPTLKWRSQLTIQANTWPSWDLFPVEPTTRADINDEKDPARIVTSPTGQFGFCRKLLPRGEMIRTLCGSRQGTVMFDGPVAISALHERRHDGAWRDSPWMSITPMELMTQRPGLRLAKGHVVIAGLGMGWALVQALRKRTVTKVTLVEKSQELVDWIMPAVAPMIRGLGKDMDTIVGDAYEVLPRLTADVALVDVFESYGSNDFLEDLYWKTARERPKHRGCPNIPVVWSWGGAAIGGSLFG